MKKQEIKKTGVVTLTRIQNSINGNPKYSVAFKNDVTNLTGKTASDYSFCYSLPYSCSDKPAKVAYHVTPTGKVIFTNIEIL